MRVNESSLRKFLYDNWLTMLIVLQPLLDILAFWTQNNNGTIAGRIRLAIMIALPIMLLISLRGERRKKLFIALCIVGGYCLLHVLNGLRVGNYMLVLDTEYMARVVQMPVLALCFMAYLDGEERALQVERGLHIAAAVLIASLVISALTHTANSTYPDGIGISGWVIVTNGNSASIILTILALSSVLSTLKDKPIYLTLIFIVGSSVFLIANGTKACYFSLLLMCVCGVIMLVLTWICGDRARLGRDIAAASALVLVAVLSLVLYPYTPAAAEKSNIEYSKATKESYYQVKYPDIRDGDCENDTPSEEDKPADWDEYMNELYTYFIPEDMQQRFGLERIMEKYDYTDDVGTLMDVRRLKRTFARLAWDETDLATRLVGFQFYAMNTSPDETYDLENDWAALKYYYGYLGAGLYIGFLLYVLFVFLRRLLRDFKGAVNMRNMTYSMLFVMELGLAQYSGAILRRPNVSFYLAITAAMLYYENMTAQRIIKKESKK